MVQKSHLFIIPFMLLLAITLAGCGSLSRSLNRDDNIHKSISHLELGISRSEALALIGYDPDHLTREVEDGQSREILTYKGWHAQNTFSISLPMIYTLIFEDNQLVVVDIQEDYHERRIMEMRRLEQERMQLKQKRIQAEKDAAGKKKTEEQKKK